MTAAGECPELVVWWRVSFRNRVADGRSSSRNAPFEIGPDGCLRRRSTKPREQAARHSDQIDPISYAVTHDFLGHEGSIQQAAANRRCLAAARVAVYVPLRESEHKRPHSIQLRPIHRPVSCQKWEYRPSSEDSE